VDDALQTSNPRIFAAGDVALNFKFTHTADAAARIVIQNALFPGPKKRASALTVPWCTYTDPEIAHVGMYEKNAKDKGIDTIAFGHHRDDSVQTLLMNLLHKAEFAAMLPKVPMQHYGVTIIRPLIFVTEDDIKEFANLYHFSRITCQCPVGQQSMRKKVAGLLSEIEQLFPNAAHNLFQAGMEYSTKKALSK